jgi:hypothetical protein
MTPFSLQECPYNRGATVQTKSDIIHSYITYGQYKTGYFSNSSKDNISVVS